MKKYFSLEARKGLLKCEQIQEKVGSNIHTNIRS